MFQATAYLVPAVAALAAPFWRSGWKAPAIGAGVLVVWVMLAAAVSEAPAIEALRVCAIGLAAGVLCAGLSHPLLSGGVMAILIGAVFLMSPAIAHAPENAHGIIDAACTVSPYAAASAAMERSFMHDPFFYFEQHPPAADYGPVVVRWWPAPLLYLAVGVPLLAWRLRRG